METKSHFSIDNFTKKVFDSGLARPSLFEVMIADLELPSLMCEISSLPPLTILSKNVKYLGPAHQRALSIDYGGAGLTMTFHLDEELLVKRTLEKWFEKVITPGTYEANYYTSYVKDIKIRQLDKNENIVYSIVLFEAYPVSISPVELNHASMGQTSRVNVTFSYRYWKEEKTEQPSQTTPATPEPTKIKPDNKQPATRITGDKIKLPQVSVPSIPDKFKIIGGGGRFGGGGATGNF